MMTVQRHLSSRPAGLTTWWWSTCRCAGAAATALVADNSSEEDGYLIWEFGPMGHGQSANIHVTVPVTTAETFDPDAQLTAADYDDGGMTADEMLGILTVVIGLLIFAAALIIIFGSMTPDWGGGFGSGLDPDDWFWYTNGVHTIHVARTAPPPKGYTRTDPPKNYHTGRRFFPAAAAWGGTTAGVLPAAPAPVLPAARVPAPVRAAAVPDALQKIFIRTNCPIRRTGRMTNEPGRSV